MTFAQMLPFTEWLPDTSDFGKNQSAFLQNALPRADGYGPFLDLAPYSSALAAQCRGFFKAIKTDGSILIFAATSTKLYQLNNTTQAWSDVSKGSSTYSALSASDNWQFVQYINFVIAVQANAPPQVFDLTSSTNFADLGGSPPQARYAAIVNSFVVLSGLLSNPYRVQWSALGDPTGWTAGVNSSSFQDLPDGGIVRGVAGGEFGNIFQDTAIRRLIYAPGSPVIFQIQRISEDRGLYAPYSLTKSGEQIFFIGPQGFMRMDPAGYPEPIGKEKIDRTFFDDLDKSNIQLVMGASDPRQHRVFISYKSLAGVSGFFDKIVCYDYLLKEFTPISMVGEFLGSLSQPGITLESVDNISSSLDALVPSLDSFSLSVTPEMACFDDSHRLGFFRGQALEMIIHSGSQEIAPGQRMFVRGLRPITDAPTVYGSVVKRERLDANETTSTEQPMDARGFIPQRASTRYGNARIRIPAGTAWSYISGVEPDAQPEGGR